MKAHRICADSMFINNISKGRGMTQKVPLFVDDAKLFQVDGSTADCEGLE